MEFYQLFWHLLKDDFRDVVKECKRKGNLNEFSVSFLPLVCIMMELETTSMVLFDMVL